jgi:hypothetical protein
MISKRFKNQCEERTFLSLLAWVYVLKRRREGRNRDWKIKSDSFLIGERKGGIV